MISLQEIVLARDELLKRTVAYFAERPEVVGEFVAGSLAAGSTDAYSDIDLLVIATPEEQTRLVGERLEAPSHWGELLFKEWVDGAFHYVSHFRPFLKIDVFCLSTSMRQPSPWLKFPAKILLDRTGAVRDVIEQSVQLRFRPPADPEVSRVLSRALAAAHEVVRRLRRGEIVFRSVAAGASPVLHDLARGMDSFGRAANPHRSQGRTSNQRPAGLSPEVIVCRP